NRLVGSWRPLVRAGAQVSEMPILRTPGFLWPGTVEFANDNSSTLTIEIFGYCSHGLAKPHMTRIGVESRMPGHKAIKRVQFLRWLHQSHPAIVLDSRCHAAG